MLTAHVADGNLGVRVSHLGLVLFLSTFPGNWQIDIPDLLHLLGRSSGAAARRRSNKLSGRLSIRCWRAEGFFGKQCGKELFQKRLDIDGMQGSRPGKQGHCLWLAANHPDGFIVCQVRVGVAEERLDMGVAVTWNDVTVLQHHSVPKGKAAPGVLVHLECWLQLVDWHREAVGFEEIVAD